MPDWGFTAMYATLASRDVIHYDRVGEDGIFSHKEITVFFVPNLSECLPALDTWRTQWLAHKKDLAERERLLAVKDKRSMERKESEKDKVKAEKTAKKDAKDAKTNSAVPGKEADKGKGDDAKVTGRDSNKKSPVDPKGGATPLAHYHRLARIFSRIQVVLQSILLIFKQVPPSR